MSNLLIYDELNEVQERVFNLLKLQYSKLIIEPEGIEYGACEFDLNQFSIKFRVSKITPKKNGQFVTLWKRSSNGSIRPYDNAEMVDFFIIHSRKNNNFGQFIFPKSCLSDQDIFSINHIGGRRAIRVYPPWDEPDSRQAKNTQKWQLDYFLEIPKNLDINISRAKKLYHEIMIGK